MAFSIRTVTYFYTPIQAEPGKPYELLARLADEDVNLYFKEGDYERAAKALGK